LLAVQRQLDDALRAYRDSLAIAERMATADSSNMQWQSHLSVSYEKVGDVLKAQSKLDEALNAYRDSVAIRERQAAADPSSTQWGRGLSISYNRVGDVLKAQGKLDEALKAYRDSLAIRERLTAANPSNTQSQADLLFTISRIGGLAYNFILARKFETALDAADQAISAAPDEIWLYSNRAHALMFLDHIDRARALYLQYRAQQNVFGKQSWEMGILEDFAEFQKAGLTHPLMQEIEKAFAGS
jgi:tetratricopeptide (TPR) repeat protein